MKPSAQISGSFKYHKKKCTFTISGRGTSVLGSIQGDHVTAYSLIEHGIKNALENITVNDDNAISDPREQRGRLYDFLSKIGALNPDKRIDLFDSITLVLQRYNKIRFKKSDFSEAEKALRDEKDNLNQMQSILLNLRKLNSTSNSVEKLLNLYDKQKTLYEKRAEAFNKDLSYKDTINNRLIRDTLTEMSEIIMTFYNHIPKTAFLKIEGFEATKSEGQEVRKALSLLEGISSHPAAKQQKSVNTIVYCLSNLLHYPKITNEEALSKHQIKTNKLTSSLATPRTNSLNDLTSIVSRHLFIAFASYPNLGFQMTIVKSFASEIASLWNINPREFETKVVSAYNLLIMQSEDEHLTSYDKFQDALSSAKPPSEDSISSQDYESLSEESVHNHHRVNNKGHSRHHSR